MIFDNSKLYFCALMLTVVWIVDLAIDKKADDVWLVGSFMLAAIAGSQKENKDG